MPGGGVWFPAHSNVTCTGKGVKIDPTRTTIYDNYINDTDCCCCVPILLTTPPPPPPRTSAERIHSRGTSNDTEVVNPPFIVPSLSLKDTVFITV